MTNDDANLMPAPGKMPNPVLIFKQFFSFPLIENADHQLLGGKSKFKG